MNVRQIEATGAMSRRCRQFYRTSKVYRRSLLCAVGLEVRTKEMISAHTGTQITTPAATRIWLE